MEKGGSMRVITRLTRLQREALRAIFLQNGVTRVGRRYDTNQTYREFRRTVSTYPDGTGCIMVPWCGMFVGIEVDGHTHS